MMVMATVRLGRGMGIERTTRLELGLRKCGLLE